MFKKKKHIMLDESNICSISHIEKISMQNDAKIRFNFSSGLCTDITYDSVDACKKAFLDYLEILKAS